MNTDSLLNRFQRYLSSERHYSFHTARNYLRELERSQPILESLGMDDWTSAKQEQLQRLIAKLHRQGLSPRSLSLTLSALRQFFEFLILEDRITFNPAKALQAPKQSKPLPKNLDVDQMQQLLDIDDTDPVAVRDQAMMELFYSSGLRLAELVNIDLADLDYQQQLLRVTGKGEKTRVLPVTGLAITRVQQWLKHRPLWDSQGTQALFISNRGNRISHRNVQARLAKWGRHQSVGAKVHPHKLRHAFATHMLESSKDLRAVQELLGHANLSTTQVYTHLDFQHLAEVYDNAHPRAQKKPPKD